MRVAVGIGTAADQAGAGLAGGNEQLLGARIVEQSLLRKYANLDVDRPGVIALEAADGVKAAQRDARVDLDMRAHARRSLQDRLFERPPRTRIDVILGESAFGGSDLADRLFERPPLGAATV